MDAAALRSSWLDSIAHTHTPKSCVTATDHTRRFLRWLGGKPLDPAAVLAYREARLMEVQGVTVNSEMRTLHAWLAWCALRGLVESNPCDGLPRLPNGKHPHPAWLNDDEVRLVLREGLSCNVLPFVTIALYAGLRRDELLQLRGEDIDLEKKVIWVRHAPELGQVTKSKKTRTVPLHPQIAALFPAAVSGPLWKLSRQQATRLMRKLRRKTGIAKFTWKTCRHTFASRLATAGVSLKKLQHWLGHESIQTTEIYAHLQEGVYDEDVARAR